MKSQTKDQTYRTDLGRELAAIREEALRRIQAFEGRRLEHVRLDEKLYRISTEELVERGCRDDDGAVLGL
jgi:hypothetical protein